MRARFAYITSLGTTAILVAAALLMLGVVGAIVAFHGWPGSAQGKGVRSLPLAPTGPNARVALVRRAKVIHGTKLSRSPRGITSLARGASTRGLVKQTTPPRSPVITGIVMVPVRTTTHVTTTPEPVQPVGPSAVLTPDRRVPPTEPSGPGAVPYPSVPLPGLAQVPIPVPAPETPVEPDEVAGTIGQMIPPLPAPPEPPVKLPGI
jgi:hypothetical protein